MQMCPVLIEGLQEATPDDVSDLLDENDGRKATSMFAQIDGTLDEGDELFVQVLDGRQPQGRYIRRPGRSTGDRSSCRRSANRQGCLEHPEDQGQKGEVRFRSTVEVIAEQFDDRVDGSKWKVKFLSLRKARHL